MKYVLVRHSIKDYSAWKKVFDESATLRDKYDIRNGWVFRNSDDSNEIFVMLEAADLKRVHDFFDLPELKKMIDRAGVTDKLDIFYLEEADQVRMPIAVAAEAEDSSGYL